MYSGSRLMGFEERSYWPSFPYLRYLVVICPGRPETGCWLVCHCSSSQTKEDFQSKWVILYRFSSSIMSYCFPPSDLWVFFSPRSLISRSYHYVATLPTSNSTAIVAYQLKASFLWTIACFTHRIPQKSIDQCQLKHRHHFNTMKFNGCLSVATVDAWKNGPEFNLLRLNVL